CDLMGIYNWSIKTNTSTTNVYFNTIYISGGTQTPNPNTKSYCVRLDGTTVYNMNVKNNIMVSTRATTGSTSLHYGFFGAAPLGSLTCDNNDYSVSGEASVLGYYGSDMTALPIVSGQDANSKAIDPGFSYIGATYPLATDYAISATTLKADATTGILTDYLGKIRPAVPTMGAFDPNGVAGINDTKMQLPFQLAHTTTGIRATFENDAVIELYSINGQMIEKTKATGSYTRNLNKGVYVIRINGNASKFIM
ncbi:MAG: T9SS type A sorting domain-containing protein, partial [Paludibacter sp.]